MNFSSFPVGLNYTPPSQDFTDVIQLKIAMGFSSTRTEKNRQVTTNQTSKNHAGLAQMEYSKSL